MDKQEIESLKQQNNIIDVANRLGFKLKTTNTNDTTAVKCCFGHEDKNPSLVLQPNTHSYKCRSCGAKGDTISLIQKVKGMKFLEALEFLGADINKPEQVKEDAYQYLKRKRIPLDLLKELNVSIGNDYIKFDLGNGHFKKRLFNNNMKWTQSRGATTTLYKVGELGKKKNIILAEGEIDAISIYQHTGLPVWSATAGAGSFPDKLIEEFKEVNKIYIAYDKDRAGKDGAIEVAKKLGEDRCYKVDVLMGNDWGEYFSIEEISNKKTKFNENIKNSLPFNSNIYDKTSLSFNQIVSLPDRGNVYLVDGLIPKGCTIIGAPPKAMKSFIMLHLLKCFVESQPLFGEFLIENPKKILLLDRENDPYTIKRRVEQLEIGNNNLLHHNHNRETLKKEENVNSLMEYIDRIKPGVVVFDSFVRFLDGDENSSQEVSRFFRIIDRIKDKDIDVIIIHHNNKNQEARGSNKMRGSGDLSAYPDATIQIKKTRSKNRTILEIKQTDNRHDEELGKFGVEVVTALDSLNMLYISGEDLNQNKTDEAKLAVRKYFIKHTDLTTKKINELKNKKDDNAFTRVGMGSIREALKEMEDSKDLTCTTGERGIKIYNSRVDGFFNNK